MTQSSEQRVQEVLSNLKKLCDDLSASLTPTIAARVGTGALGIFDCEDYKCDDSFKCTDFKCSGGGFKCNDVFKISAEFSLERGGSERPPRKA